MPKSALTAAVRQTPGRFPYLIVKQWRSRHCKDMAKTCLGILECQYGASVAEMAGSRAVA